MRPAKAGLFLCLLYAAPAFASARVVLLHFSDYHSHALPFYSEGRRDQGGIARAIHYLDRAHRNGALVFSGGDMINKGSPSWSDKYTCAEWPWLNGIVDAMALGNHDPDYGAGEFAECRSKIRYPILSANTNGFQRSAVFKSHGIRVGVFALAGSDFPALVHTPGFTFSDRIAAARDVVADLRQRADVVVLIGHETLDDDITLAHRVPGIDIILGTHSHLKRELEKIDGTNTWIISPFQYLTYISRVELTFDDEHKLTKVGGGLVRVDSHLPSDARIAKRVASMESALEHDPQYSPLFVAIGRLKTGIRVEQLGEHTVALMRDVARADFAISTTSSFRQDLPPGTITMETLRNAMPYDNEIVTATMSGAQVQNLIDFKGDAAYHTPIKIDPNATYRVATTDYLTNVSAYKSFFSGVGVEKTGLRVREQLAVSFRASEASRGIPFARAVGSFDSLRSLAMTHNAQ
jgi:5'-nucleotidase